MANIKIYTDEDVDVSVCKALRLRNIDAFTTYESGNSGSTDEEQLEYAPLKQAVILTFIYYETKRSFWNHISKTTQRW